VRPYVLAPSALRHWGAIRLPDGLGDCAPRETERSSALEAAAPDDATLAGELSELRRSHAALERRLAELELTFASHVARTAPPPPPAAAVGAGPAASKGAP
jgi:hypothetical protein